MSNIRAIPFTEIIERIQDLGRSNADNKQRLRGIVNEIYTLDIPKEYDWSFLKASSAISTIAEYKSGFASVVIQGTTVNLQSSNTISSAYTGRKIKFNGNPNIYDFTFANPMGNDSYTKLLLHCNGTDGSTSFIDVSPSPKTVTAFGNAQIDTAQSVFGGASALLDGAGSYLSIPDDDDFDFGTGDLTVDCRVRFNALPVAGSASAFFHQYQNDDNRNHWDIYNSAGSRNFRFVSVSAAVINININSSALTLATNTWYHLAVVRSSNIFTFFQDGSAIGGAVTNTASIVNLGSSIFIGREPYAGFNDDFNGWIDEYRISKGIARWFTAFTSPTYEYGQNTGGAISPPLSGITNVSTGGYTIFQPIYTLPADFDRFPINGGLLFYSAGQPKPLPELVDDDYYEQANASPISTPEYCRLVGYDTIGVRQVEIIPPPSQVYILLNEYLKTLPPMYENTMGTVVITSNQTAVTGTNTIFTQINTGDYLRFDPFGKSADSTWYRISAISSDTNLTLATNFRKDSSVSGSFTICSVPQMPYKFHNAIIYGTLRKILPDQKDPMLVYANNEYLKIIKDNKVIDQTRHTKDSVELIAEDYQYRR